MARTRRTRILKTTLLTLAAVLVVGAGALAWAIHESDPPTIALETARSAVETARTAEAERYAPAPYATAKTLLQTADVAYRGAEARWLGFLDYREVLVRCEQARAKADEALQTAIDARRSARDSAQASIKGAAESLVQAQLGLARGSFSSSLRMNMVRSELLLSQARSLLARGDFPAANVKAASALSGLEVVNQRIDSYLEEYTSGKQAQLWARWVNDTLKDSRRSGGPAVIVDKLQRTCTLYRAGKVVRSYKVDLGSSPFKQKMRAGDRATPEGRYFVTSKRSQGQTRYYKALMINYPNDEDRKRFRTAQKKGWISSRSSLGSLIEIHGDGGRNEDWTLGCVALANRDMDHLFAHVSVGTPITIVGTRADGQG